MPKFEQVFFPHLHQTPPFVHHAQVSFSFLILWQITKWADSSWLKPKSEVTIPKALIVLLHQRPSPPPVPSAQPTGPFIDCIGSFLLHKPYWYLIPTKIYPSQSTKQKGLQKIKPDHHLRKKRSLNRRTLCSGVLISTTSDIDTFHVHTVLHDNY